MPASTSTDTTDTTDGVGTADGTDSRDPEDLSGGSGDTAVEVVDTAADDGGDDDEGDGASLVEEGDIAADYLERLLDILDYDGDIDLDVENDRAIVAIVGSRLQPLVGSRGETLDALQELTRLAVAQRTGNRSRLMLDVGGHRATRRSELSALAADTAAKVVGDRLALAEAYAELLCSDGVDWGLLGPRETVRIWERHLLNCAVVAELFEPQCRVVDVGSGAGLPGLAVAIARPDLTVELVEPLQRRAEFLAAAIRVLGLAEQVIVFRGRAEERATVRRLAGADWVTARAVAPVDRLVRWCLPLTSAVGWLALIKGASARQELAARVAEVRAAGGVDPVVVECGRGTVTPPTSVVIVGRRHVERRGSHD